MRRQRRNTRRFSVGGGLVITMLMGCNSYEPRDYLAVCTEGKGHERAAAYDPAADSGFSDYPLFVAEKLEGNKHWIWGGTPGPLGEVGVAAPFRKNHERTQLVVCVEQKEGAFGRDCDMTGRIVKMYDANYQITVREARTARVLATKTYDAKVGGECPLVVAVSMTEKEPKRYAKPPESLIAELVAPHLPPKIREKLVEAAAAEGAVKE